MRFEDQREVMINEQLIGRNIIDPLVIKAFKNVAREDFVPDNLKDFSYNDYPLNIDFRQTISQPYIVALMMQSLELESTDLVLEIGTGSGYLTALLAEIVKDVYSVETIPQLSRTASQILKSKAYKNIFFRTGDGSEGWKNAYPPTKEFNKIIVSAGSPQIPKALVNQLSENGKLILPVGEKDTQELILISKKGKEITETKVRECAFVPLIGKQGWKK